MLNKQAPGVVLSTTSTREHELVCAVRKTTNI